MQHYSQDTVVDKKAKNPGIAKCSPEATLLQEQPASERASFRLGSGPKPSKVAKESLVLSYTEEDSGPPGLQLLHGRTPSSVTNADQPEGVSQADKDDGKNFTETTSVRAENSVPRLLMKKEKFVQRQAAIEISGVKVHFPFQPYGCQIEYMNRVMQALNEGKNALLESPTGTGKTLSLLCATLAWVRHQRELEAQQKAPSADKAPRTTDSEDRQLGNSGHGPASGTFVPDFNLPLGAVGGPAQAANAPKKQPSQRHQIIYCSRTISQLSQVINELKSTAYDPKSVILASRDHTCVNPSLQEFKGYNLQNRCNRAIKSRKCEFFHEYSQRAQVVPAEPYDIEDLHQIARELTICPFYMNKERAGQADLILMSYNYMLYESMRPNNTLNYTDSIIVFDEAHNVPKCAEDAASFQLETDALLQLVFTLKNLQDAIQHSKQKFSSTINDIEGIRSITSGFLNYLQDYDFNSNEHDQERIQNSFLDKSKLAIPGHCIFNIFFQGINSERRCQDFEEHIFQSHWESFWVRAFKRALADFSENYYDCSTLHNWFQFIQKVISFQGRFEDIHDYYVLLQETDAKKDSKLHLLNQSKQQGYNGVYVGAYTGGQVSGFSSTGTHQGMSTSGNQESRASSSAQAFDSAAAQGSKLPQPAGTSTTTTTAGGPQQPQQQQQPYERGQGAPAVGQPYISTAPPSGVAGRPVKNRILRFLCFNAGVCFNQIQRLQPRSIILTSGTLAPLQSFQAELQIDFKQNLENPHVISSDQVLISILKRGVDGQCFDLSYKNRESHGMIVDLGKTIARVASLTPGGMLVFFPSYGLMEQCFDIWEKNGVSQLIASQKRLFKEPKDPKEYQLIIQKYYQAIFTDEARGSILMGVCRGRISEGLDFSDNAARCVVLVGIPYPQMADPIVILKKEYLQKKNQVNKIGLTGSQWYSQQATRAVNQAIGRVIRHVQDYGAIILMDHRYAYQSGKSQISKWLRDLISVNQNFNGLDQQMRNFYSQMHQRSFVPKLKQLEQLQLELDNDEENFKIKNGLLNKPQYNLKAIDQAGKFRHLRAMLGPSSSLHGNQASASNSNLPESRPEKPQAIVLNKRRKCPDMQHQLGKVCRGDSIDQINTIIGGGVSSSAENGAALVAHANQGNAASSNSMNNTFVCGGESTGAIAVGAQSSPAGVPIPPRAKASPTMAFRGQTNVTTAVCSGDASCKPEGKTPPQKRFQHAVKKHCQQHSSGLSVSSPSRFSSGQMDPKNVAVSALVSKGAYGVVADGSSKKAPHTQKKFQDERDEAPCACSQMQIKSILDSEQALCQKCQQKLAERFGGGAAALQGTSQHSRKRKHRQYAAKHLRRSKSSGTSAAEETNTKVIQPTSPLALAVKRKRQAEGSGLSRDNHSSSPMDVSSSQIDERHVLPSSGTEKYYELGKPQTIIHEFYPARELNAAFDNDQLLQSESQNEHSVSMMNLRRRRYFLKRNPQVTQLATSKHKSKKQGMKKQTTATETLAMNHQQPPSEDFSSSFLDTQQNLTGKSADQSDSAIRNDGDDDARGNSSGNESSQPVVFRPRRSTKIPVVIPYPRDHTTAKPKFKYNQVGLNLNPLGFKPRDDDSEDDLSAPKAENSVNEQSVEIQNSQNSEIVNSVAAESQDVRNAISLTEDDDDEEVLPQEIAAAAIESSQSPICELGAEGEENGSQATVAKAAPGQPVAQTSIFHFFSKKQDSL